ncbi:MAG: RNA polymerase factor sigma-54 [Geminicoccaceae bacterium]
MSLGLRLDIKQTQGLVMTPQLQQAIKLLQLSNIELNAYVERELQENPFLEVDERPEADAPDGPNDAGERASEPVGEINGHALDGTLDMAPERADKPSAADEGWSEPPQAELGDSLRVDQHGLGERAGARTFDDELPDLEARLSRPPSLRERLLGQMHLDLVSSRERMIGHFLIENLDEAGYIREPLGDLGRQLACSEAEVEQVLLRMQHYEPTGLFARSLAECLALQLRERNRLDPAMQALLKNLHRLANADMNALMRICGVDAEDLSDMIAEIRALDPKPGAGADGDTVQTAIPDILVTRGPGETWRVELNNATLPRVLLNSGYFTTISKAEQINRRDKEFMSERFQSATWLIKALDQRARTVLRVAEAVMERQVLFLEHGVSHLRPLVLRDIAAITNLHESTVSRATTDKYVATPRGNFPFKYFFSNALPATGGDGSGHAAEAIRQKIKRMVDQEAPAAVLSDDQIVDALKAEGVAIARRTVAKYRESLGIPSSVQRRRAKAVRLA